MGGEKNRATNQRHTRPGPGGKLSGLVRLGPHGGVMSVHRFGTNGDWADARTEDAVFVAELVGVPSGQAVHCEDCQSITTGLYGPDGVVDGIGVTHSPGCPWLTAVAR